LKFGEQHLVYVADAPKLKVIVGTKEKVATASVKQRGQRGQTRDRRTGNCSSVSMISSRRLSAPLLKEPENPCLFVIHFAAGRMRRARVFLRASYVLNTIGQQS
jgi:hypothetical protein